MDTNVGTLPTTESKTLRAKDTANVVDFWSAEPRAHGGVVSMFNAHFGSMSLDWLLWITSPQGLPLVSLRTASCVSIALAVSVSVSVSVSVAIFVYTSGSGSVSASGSGSISVSFSISGQISVSLHFSVPVNLRLYLCVLVWVWVWVWVWVSAHDDVFVSYIYIYHTCIARICMYTFVFAGCCVRFTT